MTLDEIKKENDKDLQEYKDLQKKLLIDNALEERKNSDQLQIAMNIIDRCETKNEVNKMMSLLAQKVKVGLTFDEAPIIRDSNKLVVLEKDQELSFINDPQSPNHKLIIGDNYDALNNLLITHRKVIDIILLIIT